jgi:uncharacterized Zn finger protein
MAWYYEWKPYVPVAVRRANAAKQAGRIAKKEKRELAPIQIEGRKIAKSFWGEAWCENLERYSDFANRLPRGRTYVRNGSVVDLTIERGKIKALVSGSELYTVKVSIATLQKPAWKKIKQDCSQSIASLIDLLQGRFDEGVMQRMTERDGGLFPKPSEIEMDCSCPDYAGLCKHVAAVLYGVGARLDNSPELLFTLRAVDHFELIGQAVAAENLDKTLSSADDGILAGSDLGAMFGIELDTAGSAPTAVENETAPEARTRGRKPKRVPLKKPTAQVAAAKHVPVKLADKSPKAAAEKTKPARKGRSAKPTAVSAPRSR